MRHLIPGWTHNPGVHCASTAISDAVNFHGRKLDEAMCFGLGAGLGFAYFELPGISPSRMTATRSRLLEPRFFENIGVPFNWETDPDPQSALQKAKQFVKDGVPIILRADIAHLPYYNTNTHFAGHVIGLWGFDDDAGTVFVADTGWEELQEVPWDDFNKARYGSMGYISNKGDYFPVRDPGPVNDLAAPVEKALLAQAKDLLGLEGGMPGFGIESMEKAAAAMPSWGEAEDWQWSARWLYQVIEKRGTGGGAFRLLYSNFLEQAAAVSGRLGEMAPPAEMARLARQWTELSEELKDISEQDEPRGFDSAAKNLAAIAEREKKFFTRVLEALA